MRHPPATSRHLVRTSAGHVHLQATGPDSSPSVLLVHQSPSSSRMWLPVIQLLDADVSCWAVDPLGYGESDTPPRQLTLETHAAALREAVDAVVPGPLVLVGHHTGAVVAAHAADSWGDRVVGLLLSGYPLYPDWRTKFGRLGPALRPTSIDAEGRGLHAIWRHVTGPLEGETDSDVALTIMTDRLRAGRVWFSGYVQLLSTDLDRVLRRASDPGRPTVVLSADRDPLAPFAPAVADVLGVSTTEIGGGSWVTFEHPERVATPIRDLAERVRARGSRP